MSLPSYESLTHCPKCKQPDWAMTYEPHFIEVMNGSSVSRRQSGGGTEALIHTCRECGYVTATQPADAKDTQ